MGAPVGVLALQGGVAPHRDALVRAGIASVEVRTATQLAGLRGLVLPGGESTAMLVLLRRSGLLDALDAFVRSGVPILATCAGLILAARPELRWIDADVRRNAYGSQRHSAVQRSDANDASLVFIRAPLIERVGSQVQVLARHAGAPVLVRQAAVWGATFHPELSPDSSLHATVFA